MHEIIAFLLGFGLPFTTLLALSVIFGRLTKKGSSLQSNAGLSRD